MRATPLEEPLPVQERDQGLAVALSTTTPGARKPRRARLAQRAVTARLTSPALPGGKPVHISLHGAKEPGASPHLFSDAFAISRISLCAHPHSALEESLVMRTTVPHAIFKTRVRNEALGGDNPFEWKDLSTDDVFAGKNVVVFSLPGAFTPTCSTSHLPRYEALYSELQGLGVDAVVCVSVNDAFVMYQWGLAQKAKNVFLLPDGNGEFTRKMGMLVDKSNLGFGMRSWRYSMYVEDGKIEKMFIEDEYSDNCPTDPFAVSDADTMLKYLQSKKEKGTAAA
jgi:peroxiredoxin